MSYEGYEQVLCKNGHLFNMYDIGYTELEDDCYKCPSCKTKPVWYNCVDQTNDSGDEYVIKLEVLTAQENEVVIDKYGKKHMLVVKEETYKLPKKGIGNRVKKEK